MSDIFVAGGWFMWPLLICSITIISISIERFWMLQERLVSPSGLDKQVKNLIDRDLLDDYQERAVADISSLGDLLITVYKYNELSRDLLESKLEEKSIEIKYKLEQLRALDNHVKINVALAKESPIGVDTKEDFVAIKKIMEYKT